MKIEISVAVRNDLERIIDIYTLPELERGEAEARWFVNCYFDYHHIDVAKVEGEIRGVCFWRVEGEVSCGLGWIENLWVDGLHRNRGLGERLLTESIGRMSRFYEENHSKLRKVALATQSYRGSAIRLYERVGFRKVAEIADMYDPKGRDFIYLLDPVT